MKIKALIILLFILIVPIQLGYLYLKEDTNQGNVAGLRTVANDPVTNSLSIGDYYFRLYGYTSPYAEVTIDGQGIYDQTVALKDGYFEFNNRFSPYSPREACLSSKDQFGRISAVACLPPFPVRYNVEIGPVLIPPTISLDKPNYYIDDEVILSGQTIPNTDVQMSVFINNKKSLSLIKSAYASSTFPELSVKSDNAGNFSIALPSGNPDTFRLFAQADYKKDMSAESVKLKFEILPIWMIIVRFFLSLINLIRSRLLELIILSEILYILYVIYNYFFNPYALSRSRAIILREDLSLSRSSNVPSDLELYHLPLSLDKTRRQN